MSKHFWHVVICGTFQHDAVEQLLQKLEMVPQKWEVLDIQTRHLQYFGGFSDQEIDYETFQEGFMKIEGVTGVLFTSEGVQLTVVPKTESAYT